MRRILSVSTLTVAALAAFPAIAHPGHGAGDLAAGVAHPLQGLDHLAAMIAVGLWAALRGGRAVVVWPAAFVVAMLAGYGLGALGFATPLVEPAVLASVIVLGGFVASDARGGIAGGTALIALFGAAHGLAHGMEAPAGPSLAFPLGFAAATVLLHVAGLGLGAGLQRMGQTLVLRLLGGGAAAGGLAFAVLG